MPSNEYGVIIDIFIAKTTRIYTMHVTTNGTITKKKIIALNEEMRR